MVHIVGWPEYLAKDSKESHKYHEAEEASSQKSKSVNDAIDDAINGSKHPCPSLV
jgi:hypothetical protein